MNISPISFSGIMKVWKSHDGAVCRTYYPCKDEKLAKIADKEDFDYVIQNERISMLIDDTLGHDEKCEHSFLGETLPFYSREMDEIKIINKRKNRDSINSLWYIV
ncbi:MAG: hypothetical protein LUG16_06920 [Candidatus Gastranaerophilales bacterium]|nr:hypothetical protein [Candidatus Gastranaerophilales bacterium]